MNPNFTPQAAAQLQEGIELLLSRWTALRMAVENEWGGRDSLQKAHPLGQQLFHRLTQSREQVYIDDVEEMLDEFMDSLSTVIEDGSIEEIAEELMFMREECLQGDFETINRLRVTIAASVAYTIQPGNNDDDDGSSTSSDDDDDGSSSSDDDDDDDDADNSMEKDKSSDMKVDDATQNQTSINQTGTMADESSLSKLIEEVDGWTLVSSRRNKGRRN